MHSVVTRRIGYPRLAASNQTRGYPFLVTRFLVRAFLVAKQTIRRVTCWYGFPVPNYPNDRPYPRDTCPTHVAGVTAAKPIYSAIVWLPARLRAARRGQSGGILRNTIQQGTGQPRKHARAHRIVWIVWNGEAEPTAGYPRLAARNGYARSFARLLCIRN